MSLRTAWQSPVGSTRTCADRAGIPEVVHDRVSGLLVDAGEASQLARALAALVQDGALRARLGEAAREYVRPRFGIDGYVASIAGLYDRLLAAKGLA